MSDESEDESEDVSNRPSLLIAATIILFEILDPGSTQTKVQVSIQKHGSVGHRGPGQAGCWKRLGGMQQGVRLGGGRGKDAEQKNEVKRFVMCGGMRLIEVGLGG